MQCEEKVHPGIKCGAEGCHCHDDEELVLKDGVIPILIAEDTEVTGKAAIIKRCDRVVITIEMDDNSAQEIVNLLGSKEADKLSWTMRMYEGDLPEKAPEKQEDE